MIFDRERYINSISSGKTVLYKRGGILKMYIYIDHTLIRIANIPYLGSDVHDFDVTIVESWTPRLEYFMYKTYAELRLVNIYAKLR